MGVQNAPGETILSSVDAGLEDTGLDVAGLEATGLDVAGLDVAGLEATGLGTTGLAASLSEQLPRSFAMRANSLSSIDNFQRAFTATQLSKYVQWYETRGGIQLLGSLSDFFWFTESVTAKSVRGSLRSLANAVRCAVVHAHAPESHASFNATTWSISMSPRSVHLAPS